MDPEPRIEKLYRHLLALCSLCAIAATGIISIRDILRPPTFNLAKPNFHGALCSGLMGLGFVFGSFQIYAQGKSKEKPKLPAYNSQLILLLVGIIELCFSGLITYSDLKVLGY